MGYGLVNKYSRVNVIAGSSLKAEAEPPISRPTNAEKYKTKHKDRVQRNDDQNNRRY